MRLNDADVESPLKQVKFQKDYGLFFLNKIINLIFNEKKLL